MQQGVEALGLGRVMLGTEGCNQAIDGLIELVQGLNGLLIIALAD